MSRPGPNRPGRACVVWVVALIFSLSGAAAAEFEQDIRPLLQEFCFGCHSTEKHKGDLDLEQFTSRSDAIKQPKVWQALVEQLSLGEMPPKSKPQPSAQQRAGLLGWADGVLNEIATARAGDPGPVVLRRLCNAEYTYTIRDLTGVATLDPAKEFPTDSASGEGFMNVGQSLVMSPALVAKYLDAAKNVASHAVLLPDGIGFSPHTSERDWTEERLSAIRAFYEKFTVNGGGTAVNLQGIKFDTKDGGVLPLERYLVATLEERSALASGTRSIPEVAQARALNEKYLAKLWAALNDPQPSLVLDIIREAWAKSQPKDVAALVRSIQDWQQALWRFTTIGHIGKRDGPKAWQVPATPLAQEREIRLKLAPAKSGQPVVLYLVASDAGDGNEHDFALWDNPRLVAPGRANLPLREVRPAVAAMAGYRATMVSSAQDCLEAAAEVNGPLGPAALTELAQEYDVAEPVLKAWLDYLGIGGGPAVIQGRITNTMASAQGYDFIQGWTGADALSVVANSSDQAVRIPGNMKPHSVAVHPSPTLRVAVGWRSPMAGTMRIEGLLKHAHPECGNGVTWALEVRRGRSRQRLATGTAQGAREVKLGPFLHVALQPRDIVAISVGARDGNHSCDLTAVDLNLSDGAHTWDLAQDVSPDILTGNPHPDRLGNAKVWHFYSEPDSPTGSDAVLPTGSLLAKWQSAANFEEKERLAGAVQQLLSDGVAGLAKDDPNAILYRELTSLSGPLLSPLLRNRQLELPGAGAAERADSSWGVDPDLFGKDPSGEAVEPAALCVHAPSVIEVRLPADLADGCEFVTTARLHNATGAEGSVQMQVLTNRPTALSLAPSVNQVSGNKGTWSDGERPLAFDTPILVQPGSSARRRMEAAFAGFRDLFPAALCYTKIVPVDEVVTLTLFYREDDHLRRLMLDEAQTAELDRLWSELHYVSRDALKLVDAFEQLWQFATQDADPSAFEPLRQPIKQRADAFRKLLADTQLIHQTALRDFAERAYRRPLTGAERDELEELYRKLRAEGIGHEDAIRLGLARVLVSPAFLYRAEEPVKGQHPGPINDWELATRLSYFLWSSLPDAELRHQAAAGRLRDPRVLAAQALRLERDPRVRRLATEFACAWLHVYAFDELSEKSERHFPTFNGLRTAMYEETIRFFTALFQHNSSVLEILNADYAFVNPDLARHYNLPGQLFAQAAADPNDDWRQVQGVRKFGRGGILGLASTLAKQSGASRTSPILRGNWVAEVLLGEKLPRPPKDVPRLPEDEATETLTVRQLTEKHSSDPKCYTCHRRIDGYGFALEGFDAIGRWRDQDLGGRPIDTHAKVMDGSDLDGVDGLRRYLLNERRDTFLAQFCRKLLGYALGRAVMLSDRPLISDMCERLKANHYRISAAIEAIVLSRQFRDIRGQDQVDE